MTQEDKELLLIDLCARLPYDFYIKEEYGDYVHITLYSANIEHLIDRVVDGLDKLVLRPMSSMTEEEKKIQKDYIYHFSKNSLPNYEGDFVFGDEAHEYIDWLNKNHFDYRGLIEKGLALVAGERKESTTLC